MKRLLVTMLVSIFICSTVFPQIPQAFKYQSVVRNSSGDIIVNQLVSFQISIHAVTATGPVEYQETHSVSTNDFGVANLNVGEGLVVSGVFADIDWTASDKFMEVELDPSGGSAYVVMGTTQLISVPYALYADKSGSAPSIADTDGDTYIEVEETPDDDIIRFYNAGSETYRFNGKNIQVFDPDLNVLLGQGTGTNLVAGTAVSNTFVGYQAGYHNTEGFENTFIGKEAGFANTDAHFNTFIGSRAGLTNEDGAVNTFVGQTAGRDNLDGKYNCFVGCAAGGLNTSGEHNTYIGTTAGMWCQGSNNVYIGSYSGSNSYTGNNNVFIGSHAGGVETGSNKLYISNYLNETYTTLIYGEFDTGKVTINDILQLSPRSSAPVPAEEGMIYYDNTSKQIFYHNGTSWVPL